MRKVCYVLLLTAVLPFFSCGVNDGRKQPGENVDAQNKSKNVTNPDITQFRDVDCSEELIAKFNEEFDEIVNAYGDCITDDDCENVRWGCPFKIEKCTITANRNLPISRLKEFATIAEASGCANQYCTCAEVSSAKCVSNRCTAGPLTGRSWDL